MQMNYILWTGYVAREILWGGHYRYPAIQFFAVGIILVLIAGCLFKLGQSEE